VAQLKEEKMIELILIAAAILVGAKFHAPINVAQTVVVSTVKSVFAK